MLSWLYVQEGERISIRGMRTICSTSALQDQISQHSKERCSVMTGVGVLAIRTDDAMF